MTKQTEALKLALEALITASGHVNNEAFVKVMMARDSVVEALAQPEQEPTFYIVEPELDALRRDGRRAIVLYTEPITNGIDVPLYTTPPQRTWVSLTPQDYNKIFEQARTGEHAVQLADAKLRELNGG